MKKSVCAFVFAAVMATGCSYHSEDTNKADTKEHNTKVYGSGCRDFETGGVFTATGTPNKTVYIDYGTMKKSALCAVPNCTHSSSSCLAAQAYYPVIYKNCVYFFTHNESVKDTPDGPELSMDSKLKKAYLDSSETEVECSFTDSVPRNSEAMVIIGDKLYFSAYDPDATPDEYGSLSYKTGGGYEYLCSIDLDSGEYRNYGSICYVEDEYPAADNSSHSFISGAADGKIFITYGFKKDNASKDFTYYSFEFDTKTEKYSRSSLPALLCAEGNVYAWLDIEAQTLHIQEAGKQYEVKYTSYSNSAKILGDKLFLAGGWVSLDDMLKSEILNSSE